MSIDIANLLIQVAKRTGRAGALTSIEDELTAILDDLSTVWPFLQKTDTVTITASGSSVALSTLTGNDFRSMISVVDASDNILRPLPSWTAYRALVSQSAADGTSIWYIIFDESIHVYPSTTSELVLTLDYNNYIHYTTGDTITLPDHFREAITEGLCWQVIQATTETDLAAVHKGLYDEKVAKLINRYRKQRSSVEIVES